MVVSGVCVSAQTHFPPLSYPGARAMYISRLVTCWRCGNLFGFIAWELPVFGLYSHGSDVYLRVDEATAG